MNLSGCTLAGTKRIAPRWGRDFLFFQNDLFLFWDGLAGLLFGYSTDLAYLRVVWRGTLAGSPPPAMLHEMVLCSVIAALLLREPALVTDRRLLAFRHLVGMLCRRGMMVIGVLLVAGMATRALDHMARLWLTGWCACFACWVLASRFLFVCWARYLQFRGDLQEAIAVVGVGGTADRLAAKLRREAEVVLVLDSPADQTGAVPDQRALERLLALARAGVIETVVLASPADSTQLAPLIEVLRPVPVQIAMTADLPQVLERSAGLRRLAGIPLAIIAQLPTKHWQLLAKGLLDRALAGLLLVLCGPLMATIALLVALDSPGPVIFRQRRSGRAGRPFTLYKFRSMAFTPWQSVRRQTARNDARLTRIGGTLRRSSLDELPQLWNVLIGDMSLVGPRPHVDALHHGERADDDVLSEYARRQRVKPGLTGWAQVNGLRGPATCAGHLRQRIEHDLFYIDNWSLLFDLQILALTPWQVICGGNAF